MPLGFVHVICVLDDLGLDFGALLVVGLARENLVILAHALFSASNPVNCLARFIEHHRRLATRH